MPAPALGFFPCWKLYSGWKYSRRACGPSVCKHRVAARRPPQTAPCASVPCMAPVSNGIVRLLTRSVFTASTVSSSCGPRSLSVQRGQRRTVQYKLRTSHSYISSSRVKFTLPSGFRARLPRYGCSTGLALKLHRAPASSGSVRCQCRRGTAARPSSVTMLPLGVQRPASAFAETVAQRSQCGGSLHGRTVLAYAAGQPHRHRHPAGPGLYQVQAISCRIPPHQMPRCASPVCVSRLYTSLPAVTPPWQVMRPASKAMLTPLMP